MKKILYLISFLLPWPLRRRFLVAAFGYVIHPTSHIGLAWVMPERLTMEPHSTIGTLTVCKGLKFLHLKQNSLIGRANCITLSPLRDQSHYTNHHDPLPDPILD